MEFHTHWDGVYRTLGHPLSQTLGQSVTAPSELSFGAFLLEERRTIRCHTNFRHPFKLYVDGKTAIEIDKFNYVAKFGDTDILSSVRGDLGLN